MEKRTLYALVAAVALGALAFFTLRAPEKGQRVGPPPRPIPAIKANDVAQLEVTDDKGATTKLERVGATDWKITAPGDWKADNQAVKMLLDGLEKLQFNDVASENVEKQSELGVGDKGARVVAKNGARTLADLHVGKLVGGYTMVRIDGKNETWQTGGLPPYAVNKAPATWRDHAIFSLTAADIDKVTIDSGANKLVVERDGADKGNESKWKLVQSAGAAPKDTKDLDLSQINAAVQGLANLHASDFADDKKVDDVKGKGPSITVSLKDKSHTLWVGDTKGEDLYTASSDGPQVYLVRKYAIEHIAKKPIDYRDKTIVKVKPDEIASVDITAGGETTTLTQGKDGKWTSSKGAVDEGKVKPAVEGFENLVANGFADETSPAKTGLAKPTGRAVLHLKNKQTVTINVGAATADGDYYVQKGGSPDVLLIKKFAVDRWMKKPAGLTAKK